MSKEKKMLPNFFCDTNTLQALLNYKEKKPISPDLDFTVDLIELPLMLRYRCDETSQKMEAISRGIICDYEVDSPSEIKKGEIVYNKETRQFSVKASQELGQNMPVFMMICRQLSEYILDTNLQEMYSDLPANEGGIKLSVGGNGEIKAKVVRGRNRPNLMVMGLFGGGEMSRPYADEFMERSMMDLMDDVDFEDKLELAENGDLSMMNDVMLAYIKGDEEAGIEPDPEKAVYWMQRLADEDVSVGQFNLGLHYAKGYGVPRDFEKAAYWMERAAENGDDDAVKNIPIYKKAAENIKLAENGDPQAQADIAKHLMGFAGTLEEAGPEEDYKESVMWAQKAAAKFNLDAIYILGLAYYFGRGVKEDKQKAAALYRRAAEKGHAPSQANLASMYLNGEGGLEVDMEKGREWAIKSAEQNDMDGMRITAAIEGRYFKGINETGLMIGEFKRRMLLNGRMHDVNDLDEFLALVKEVAAEGDELSQRLLAIIEEEGEHPDDELIQIYLAKAENDGKIPPECDDMEQFLSALQEYVAEGDAKAQQVIDMLTASDDEEGVEGEELLQRYFEKAMEDGKLSEDDEPGVFLSALQEYASEGDEEAQMLLDLLS